MHQTRSVDNLFIDGDTNYLLSQEPTLITIKPTLTHELIEICKVYVVSFQFNCPIRTSQRKPKCHARNEHQEGS